MGLDVFHVVAAKMNGSRWRKAIKCKSLIKQLKIRLMMKKSRTNAIIRQLCCDIAKLHQRGRSEIALSRVDQLYKDRCMLSAYGQLEQYCDCISTNLGDISRHSDLSSDVVEALSGVIYAASRCGDIPELHEMRNLFKEHYGPDFESLCIDLLPGNNVNPQLRHNLRVKRRVPDDIKMQLTNEIAKHGTLGLGTLQISDQNLAPAECQKLAVVSRKKRKFKKKDTVLDLAIDQEKKVINKIQVSNLLWRVSARFSLSACKKLVSSWFGSFGESHSTFASTRSTAVNAATVQTRNNKTNHFTWNNKTTHFTALHSRAGTLDSKGTYDTEMFSDTRRDATCDRSSLGQNKMSSDSKSQPLQNFNYEGEIVTEIQEIENDSGPCLSHVHPKLPEYDDLVAKFTLKKDITQKQSNSGVLGKWMSR